SYCASSSLFFSFQAEDGIRDRNVTGVQTCALPICHSNRVASTCFFTLKAARTGNTITVTGAGEAKNWTLCLRNVVKVNGLQDGSQAESEQGLVVTPQGNALTITL